ncbi:hypothetical protein [Shewanella sp.]|uniref:hypothetical protein n=1 Tax=Shewanella sp. TaxID=50422 RepID=UPI00260383FF|nr:hypothetical protein [Shewanella sp.]
MNNSPLTPETQDELLIQIRTAHRLLAAYYQRLLPSIEKIANQLGSDFYFWEPRKFARPASRNSNPFSKWAWDMLPAMSAIYVFKNINNESSITIDDFLISFYVDSDTGVDEEEMKRGEMDGLALSIPVTQAQSMVKIGIYTPFKNENLHWHSSIWCQGAFPDYQAFDAAHNSAKDINGQPIVSSGFEVSVSQLMTEDGIQQLTAKVEQCLARTILHAKSIATVDVTLRTHLS